MYLGEPFAARYPLPVLHYWSKPLIGLRITFLIEQLLELLGELRGTNVIRLVYGGP